MEEERLNGGVINHFEKDSNCQVFNGEVKNCVFAMPGSTVTQQPVAGDEAKRKEPSCGSEVRHEKLCLFVHPSVSEEQEWQVHDEVKRMAKRLGIQEICQYLLEMKKEHKVLLPQSSSAAYNELVRMGMPHGEGFSEKTFMKYYKR